MGATRENGVRDGFMSSGQERPLQGSNTLRLGLKDVEVSEPGLYWGD